MIFAGGIKNLERVSLLAILSKSGNILPILVFISVYPFGIQFIMAGNSVFAGLCLAFGGALFFCSDITLVILMINEKLKKNYRLKDFNIASYFIAQTLLALSVLNVGLI